MINYFIAADGGGTKTDTVLFSSDGHILKRYIGQGGNASDIGKDEAVRRFEDCLNNLIPENVFVDGLYGGIAGVLPNGDFYSSALIGKYPIAYMRFDDDGCNILSGTLGHSDGCSMIIGTGSSLFVRKQGHPLIHIGGKGYLIDTGGSGYELGKDAICMALRSVDGRIGHTVLVELVSEIIGQKVSDAIIPVVHRGGRPFIASFARAVFEGRKKGDQVCEEIFEKQAALLADLTYPAATFFDGEFTVVANGGIAAHYPEYIEEIQKKAVETARIVVGEVPPVYGAAVEAMWDSGKPVTEAFRSNFLHDYALTSI